MPRQDLQTRHLQLSLRGNSSSTRTIFGRVLLGGSVRPVPEPATALLLGLGAAGLWMVRRREVVPD